MKAQACLCLYAISTLNSDLTLTESVKDWYKGTNVLYLERAATVQCG